LRSALSIAIKNVFIQKRNIDRLIDETPKWLRASGKTDEARRIESKIAKFNKLPQNSYVKDAGLCTEMVEILGVWETVKKLAQKPILVVRVFVLSLAW